MEKLPTFKEIKNLLDEARELMPPEVQTNMLQQDYDLLTEITGMDPTMKMITYLTRRSTQMVVLQNEIDPNSLDDSQKQKLKQIGNELTKIGQRLLDATMTNN